MNTNFKNILIAPDKFKGSMTAKEFCEIAEMTLKQHFSNAKFVSCPLADGGEGSLQCFVESCHARVVEGVFTGSNFEKKKSCYAMKDKVAFIEMSQTAGLFDTKIKNPAITTSFGVGQQVFDAIKNGAKKIYIAMGGSSTNDAGCGMAAAIGCQFFNEKEESFVPTGGNLNEIKKIQIKKIPNDVEIIALSDVKNVLFGENGAAFIYAEQKGASKEQIIFLDENLRYFNELCKKYGKDFSLVEGSGAAGGLACGAMLFSNATIQSGTDTIFKLVDVDKKIQEADLIISGEGKIDEQSRFGKVVFSLYSKCKNKQFVVFCGKNKLKMSEFPVYEINRPDETLNDSIKNTKTNFRNALNDFIKYYD